MPEHVYEILTRYANEIWACLLGVLGGSVRVAVGFSEGEKMPPPRIFAILVTGAVLAGTSSKLFAGLMGLGTEATSFCSFIVGIMGMNIVNHAIETDVGSLFKKQKAKR